MNIDYEAWRCKHADNPLCPEEGCTLANGCARDGGWYGDQPGPRNDETIAHYYDRINGRAHA